MQRRVLFLVAAVLLAACGPESQETPAELAATVADEAAYAEARQAMIEDTIIARGVDDEAVLDAMFAVPRHAFVLPEYLDQAYADHPLPIGYGQTISQPYIVALMTEAIAPEPDDVVLEIGTGSGYQAAVLAEIVSHVYTIEIVGALAEQAETRLQSLGYDNITVGTRTAITAGRNSRRSTPSSSPRRRTTSRRRSWRSWPTGAG